MVSNVGPGVGLLVGEVIMILITIWLIYRSPKAIR